MAWEGQKRPKLKVPYFPEEDEDKGHFTVNTLEEKIVREYTGLSFERLEDLVIMEFWLYLRDAVVYNCSQTEKGKEYLEKCWIMEQTTPDRDALRNRAKG